MSCKLWTIVFTLTLLVHKSFGIDEKLTTEKTNDASPNFYTAAVVEFNSPVDGLSDPEEIVDANLEEYLRLIYEAGEKGVDILVFPEASLNYNGIKSYENLTEVAVELQIEVPNVSECDFVHDAILSEISYAAANVSIYVLVNVVEMEMCNETDDACDSGYKLFNTNLVFDRNGCIISRYRKFNLFIEPFMNITSIADISTFETDFGVTFGHFICFDLLFKTPAIDIVNLGITHILYPSMWYSEIPFLSSVQVQQSFAQRNNIVLLSAGTNSPSNSNSGSGIFVGKHGAVEKIISWKNETRLLIAEIPKNVDDPEYDPPEPLLKPYTAEEMEGLKKWRFTPENSFPLVDHFEFSMENITCEFTINYTRVGASKVAKENYSLVIFSGIRSFSGIVNAGEVYCAIVPKTRKGEKFEPSIEFLEVDIKLTIHGDQADYLVMPTSLDTSILPLPTNQYSFDHLIEDGIQKYSMKATQELGNLMTFGIYGRHFSLDDKKIGSVEKKTIGDSFENNISGIEDEDNEIKNLPLKITVYVTFMVVLGIITTIMVRRRLRAPYRPDFNKRKS